MKLVFYKRKIFGFFLEKQSLQLLEPTKKRKMKLNWWMDSLKLFPVKISSVIVDKDCRSKDPDSSIEILYNKITNLSTIQLLTNL